MPAGPLTGYHLWVEGPACTDRSLYLSSDQEGALHLLDADATPARPVRLAHKTSQDFHVFMGCDGMLRVVQAHRLAGPLDFFLVWHTIDPASGKTIKSQSLHGWAKELPLTLCLYQPTVHRVIGMIDDRTVAIMDADTLVEICRLHLTLDNEYPIETVMNLAGLTWSAQGNMVAVHMQGECVNEDYDIVERPFEVQIYDTSSGQRIQATRIHGCWLHMSWSDSMDKLSVYCHLENYNLPLDSDEEEDIPESTIRLLDPEHQIELIIPQSTAPGLGSEWEQCTWTPCCPLLVAQYEHVLQPAHNVVAPDSHSGVCIVDPCTLICLYQAHQGSGLISWGWRGPLGQHETPLEAYMPYLCKHVTFWRVDGMWHVHERDLGTADFHHTGSLTLDGRSLLVSGDHCLYAHDLGCASLDVLAADLAVASPSVRMAREACDWHPSHLSGDVVVSWSPLPSSWSCLFSFIHKHASSHSLKLVDPGKRSILGSWSFADLAVQAKGRLLRTDAARQKILTATWSRNGKHIAAFCDGLVFVMVF